VLLSLTGVQGPRGVEFGSHSARLNQKVMKFPKLATEVPDCEGVGSGPGIVILHSISLEEGEAVEKNWIEGSSCPKYQPLS